MSAHPPATPSTSMPSIITAIEADRIWIGGQAAHHSEHAHYVRADIADAKIEECESLRRTLDTVRNGRDEATGEAKQLRERIAKIRDLCSKIRRRGLTAAPKAHI